MVRNQSKMNFDSAKSALVLLDGTDATSEKSILPFIDFLKENKIQVESLAYFNQKESPREGRDSEIVLAWKDINWLGFPKVKEDHPLFQKEYDLLFDFSIKGYFALRCIVVLSKARFKIGMLQESSSPYEFMIDLGKERQIAEFIKQIKKYLPLLK